VLASWCVVWLGLAMQPCAMAFEISEHDQNQQHHGMSGETQHSADCPFCPSMGDSDTIACADDQAQCTYPDGIDYDGRVQQLKKADVGELLLPSTFTPVPITETVQHDQARGSAVFLTPSDPPLHLKLCVFLK
jgi:hypothetical protein